MRTHDFHTLTSADWKMALTRERKNPPPNHVLAQIHAAILRSQEQRKVREFSKLRSHLE